MKDRTTKDNKEPTIKKYNRSNLISNQYFSFYELSGINKFCRLIFESKFSHLDEFFDCFKKERKKEKCVRYSFCIIH